MRRIDNPNFKILQNRTEKLKTTNTVHYYSLSRATSDSSLRGRHPGLWRWVSINGTRGHFTDRRGCWRSRNNSINDFTVYKARTKGMFTYGMITDTQCSQKIFNVKSLELIFWNSVLEFWHIKFSGFSFGNCCENMFWIL